MTERFAEILEREYDGSVNALNELIDAWEITYYVPVEFSRGVNFVRAYGYDSDGNLLLTADGRSEDQAMSDLRGHIFNLLYAHPDRVLELLNRRPETGTFIEITR